MDSLTDFTRFEFAHAGDARTVYRKGEGPAVLVMHEVPGVTTEVLHFVRRVADAGFTVFMPHLFGPVGVKTTPFNRLPQLVRVCISREFHVLAEDRSSPIADWLRALGRRIHDEIGGRGIHFGTGYGLLCTRRRLRRIRCARAKECKQHNGCRSPSTNVCWHGFPHFNAHQAHAPNLHARP